MVKNLPDAAFAYSDAYFPYTNWDQKLSFCGLDIFVREDFTGRDVWAIVFLTQLEGEKNSLSNDICKIAKAVMEQIFFYRGLPGITPDRILWIESYPPDRAVRYGRMEQVSFGFADSCAAHGQSIFVDAFWHRITREQVERAMGFTWSQMGLREVPRYED
jgi:hypothetical protein